MKTEKPKCEECYWWIAGVETVSIPTSMNVKQIGVCYRFPATEEKWVDDFCGEYTPRASEKPKPKKTEPEKDCQNCNHGEGQRGDQRACVVCNINHSNWAPQPEEPEPVEQNCDDCKYLDSLPCKQCRRRAFWEPRT